MTLGQKIKEARLSRGLSQAKLAGDKITRNMLSAIESDKANPSVKTLSYIASRLSLPLSYFFSDNPEVDKKANAICAIKEAFKTKRYTDAISLISALGFLDDELCYILAYSHFELGRENALLGSLKSANEHFLNMKKYSNETIYDTERIVALSLIYSAVASNIQSPLLDFDVKAFDGHLNSCFDYDFYKYLMQDYDFDYCTSAYKLHLTAKNLMKQRKYADALKLLTRIENEKSESNYNAYLIFSVYGDMEICYKQLRDYENAYRYSSKRMSLIEAFK